MVGRTKTTRQRPVRNSHNGRQDVLFVEGKEQDMEYRIVNDSPGRVAQLKSMGWEIADGDEKLISSKDDSGTSDKSKHVGDGQNAVLMRMPKEWYADYQKEKQQHVDRIERKAQTSDIENGYGKVEIGQKP